MRKFFKKLFIVIVILIFAVFGYYLYDVLREKSRPEKIAQIIHDEDRREQTDRLKKYLESEDPTLRARAALALGRIGEKDCGKFLFGMLTDPDMNVASTAAFALGLTGEKGYASQLMDVVNEVPSSVAVKIVEAAGRLADSSMYDVANQLVETLSHPSPEVREAVCLALFRAGARSKTDALIKFIEREEDDLVQKTALYSLARFKIDLASAVFIKFMADPDPFARSLAVRGLSSSKTSKAEHYLAIALNDTDHGVVARAIIELAGRKSNNGRELLLKKLRNESDEKLLILVLEALEKLKNVPDDADIILTRLTPNTSDGVLAAAVKTLASIQKDRAVNFIDSLITLERPFVKAGCAEAYRIIGKSNVIPRLVVLFGDEDSMVRTAALDALIKLDTANVDFYIRKALADLAGDDVRGEWCRC